MAPEVINHDYDHRCDIWSLGIILFVMLVGYPPYQCPKDSDTQKAILKNEVTFPDRYWSRISPDAIDLVKGLLQKNKKNRLSLPEALKHPWI